ncbi:sensor histidine kinase [Natronincola ferrireducens]|uniref:Oxygen sensor histidine kinase NreB n=1 Tax=Natronincola ferrireducens TaxID=393762 RepID=A0A1G8XW48_9FIRM|nr:ATP-binding protein [Natronincola ferrireducens]SDJ94404.1 Histidine kinase [Natronincola ferrireducens]
MIYPRIYHRIRSLYKEREIFKIVFYYRYISLLITSTLYIAGDLNHSMPRKGFVVVCMTISSLLLHYLYIKNGKSTFKITLLILLETIGNSFILIPSGGLSSPYVWYSLNTILVASIKLNAKYCWLNLFIYFFSSTIAVQFIVEESRSFTRILIEESNLLLSFVLITGVIQMLVKYARRIHKESNRLAAINRQLLIANRKNKEAMNYIMEIYQGVHLFTKQENKKDFIELMIDYSRKMIRSDMVVFVECFREAEQTIIEGSGSIREEVISEIYKGWKDMISYDGPIEVQLKGRTYLLIAIGCSYRVYGILGVDITPQITEDSYKETVEQLKFLASLSAVTFEKFELEKINERLLINEEQNRIANEIHDGILQRIFSISCSIYTNIKHLEQKEIRDIALELNKTRSYLNGVMKDLRNTIYSLSWSKEGTNNFIVNIKNYIEEMKSLNNSNINLHLEGDHEALSMEQKKAIYRIICEGIGNALRHGRATTIDVYLSIGMNMSFLQILDNGIGFEPIALEREGRMGLGLKNIRILSQAMNGNLKLDSQVGTGTKITIEIPNTIQKLYEEEVV